MATLQPYVSAARSLPRDEDDLPLTIEQLETAFGKWVYDCLDGRLLRIIEDRWEEYERSYNRFQQVESEAKELKKSIQRYRDLLNNKRTRKRHKLLAGSSLKIPLLLQRQSPGKLYARITKLSVALAELDMKQEASLDFRSSTGVDVQQFLVDSFTLAEDIRAKLQLPCPVHMKPEGRPFMFCQPYHPALITYMHGNVGEVVYWIENVDECVFRARKSTGEVGLVPFSSRIITELFPI